MIYKILSAVIILATSVHAREFSFENLNMPVFGEAGDVEQILTAERGFGQFDRPVLKGGVIEFYTSQGEIVGKGSKLIFDEAIFVRGEEVVKGSGLIRFQSPRGDLSGIGFTYDIEGKKLTLHSHVVAHFEGTEVVGQSAEAVIRKETPNEKWSIDEAVIMGDVVATGFPERSDKIDRVETDQAKYTRHDGILVLSSPIHFWINGERVEADADEFRINLSEDRTNAEKEHR